MHFAVESNWSFEMEDDDGIKRKIEIWPHFTAEKQHTAISSEN